MEKRHSLIHYTNELLCLQTGESDVWQKIWNERQALKFAHQVANGMVRCSFALCSRQASVVPLAPRLRASRFGRAQCARQGRHCQGSRCKRKQLGKATRRSPTLACAVIEVTRLTIFTSATCRSSGWRWRRCSGNTSTRALMCAF